MRYYEIREDRPRARRVHASIIPWRPSSISLAMFTTIFMPIFLSIDRDGTVGRIGVIIVRITAGIILLALATLYVVYWIRLRKMRARVKQGTLIAVSDAYLEKWHAQLQELQLPTSTHPIEDRPDLLTQLATYTRGSDILLPDDKKGRDELQRRGYSLIEETTTSIPNQVADERRARRVLAGLPEEIPEKEVEKSASAPALPGTLPGGAFSFLRVL